MHQHDGDRIGAGKMLGLAGIANSPDPTAAHARRGTAAGAKAVIPVPG